MLVLSRERNETICIGTCIEIIVVEIRGDKVRLGVKAPNGVPAHRQEVLEVILREGMACRDANEIPKINAFDAAIIALDQTPPDTTSLPIS